MRADDKGIIPSKEPTSRGSTFTRWLMFIAPLAVAAFLATAIPASSSPSGGHPRLMSAAAHRKASSQNPNRGTLSPAVRQALSQGYLVPDQAQYLRQKAGAARRASASPAAPATRAGRLAPVKIRAWAGINDTNWAPPDETSAVGTTRYLELVNSDFAIYDKTSNTPIATGAMNDLVGALSTDSVFDVQVIWDPTTSRFFYAADDVASSTNNSVAFGFSKTASPTSAADFCKYSINFGSTFPDYPKLGDSKFFTMIGTNLFDSSGSTFLGSDLAAVSKPPAGTSCPAASTFKFKDVTPLRMNTSNPAFTPVPANEIDTNGTGWAVARSGTLPGTQLSLFKVTKSSTGSPVIQSTGSAVSVPSYTVPADAPQSASTNKIDTSDARMTQAVAGIDPTRSNALAIWTQQTAFGGAGAQVRWYEINPITHAVLQKGTVTSASLYEFNGAISPNRQVNGSTKSGGNSMVMNFDTSSSMAFPSIKMVSKVGTGGQSGKVAVLNGTKPLSGFDCSKVASTGKCRWGDYAAATPDPSIANRIWNVSQYAVGSGSGITGPATSRTRNFIATP